MDIGGINRHRRARRVCVSYEVRHREAAYAACNTAQPRCMEQILEFFAALDR